MNSTKFLQILFLFINQQSFFKPTIILKPTIIQTFRHVLFCLTKTLSFSIQKEKMNKRTKKYNYVKRENVAIATYLPPSGLASIRQIPLKEKKRKKNKRLQ